MFDICDTNFIGKICLNLFATKQNKFIILFSIFQAGDRSLALVVGHEIAHSWTGNLVTNANYEHFWLNEGFTMFVEFKIAGRMFGDATRDFHSIQGLAELKDCVS